MHILLCDLLRSVRQKVSINGIYGCYLFLRIKFILLNKTILMEMHVLRGKKKHEYRIIDAS